MNSTPLLIPNLETLGALVMKTITGKLRLSRQAKEILAPIFKSNGFDVENIKSIQQYEMLQSIAEERAASRLACLADKEGSEFFNLEKLDQNLDMENPVERVYAEVRGQQRLQVKQKPILHVVKPQKPG